MGDHAGAGEDAEPAPAVTVLPSKLIELKPDGLEGLRRYVVGVEGLASVSLKVTSR